MRRAAKVDTTASELTALARQLGAKVLPLNGVIDVLVCYRGRLLLVDWKTPRGKKAPRTLRTASQERMVAEGWPVHFIATAQELTNVLYGRRSDDGRVTPEELWALVTR